MREYVSRRKPQLLRTEETPYIKLEHQLGDAQVDFSRVEGVRDGQFQEMKSLTLSFPFSNGAAAVILPGENEECLCEGLKQLFERIGGVPQRVRFDNASAAVVHVGKGESRPLPTRSGASCCITDLKPSFATKAQPTRRATWRTRSATPAESG